MSCKFVTRWEFAMRFGSLCKDLPLTVCTRLSLFYEPLSNKIVHHLVPHRVYLLNAIRERVRARKRASEQESHGIRWPFIDVRDVLSLFRKVSY